MRLDRAIPFLHKLQIVNKRKQIVPFRLNYSQRLFLKKLLRREREGKPLWAIVVKARQVGISTLTEGLITAHCFSTPNAKARILAHDFPSSIELFGIAKRMRDSVPVWMPPGTQRHIIYPGTSAELKVQTAGSTTSGRGLSLSCLHLSEAAHYTGNADAMTAIIPAVPEELGTLCVIESTANGKIGDGASFFNLWISAIKGRNGYEPIFIPWTMDPEYVRDENEALDAPADEEEQDLMNSGVSRAQIAWRRRAIETRCKGLVEIFHQEFPRTWGEAFISSGNPAFNMKERRHAAKYLTPPNDVRPITILKLERDRENPKRTNFIPDRSGLVIWEKPKDGHYYYLGADVARSATEHSDFSAVAVINGNTGDQAASLVGRIDPVNLADQIDMIARMYNNAKVIIELTGGLGDWTQKTLRDVHKYHNIYRWKGARDDSLPGKTVKSALGWVTTADSRKMMFSAFREGLRYEKVNIKDPELLAQIESATYDENWRWELEIGHDDVLVSALLAWIARMQYPPPGYLTSRSIDPDTMAAEEAMRNEDAPSSVLFAIPSGTTVAELTRMQNRRNFHRVRRGKKVKDRLEGI